MQKSQLLLFLLVALCVGSTSNNAFAFLTSRSASILSSQTSSSSSSSCTINNKKLGCLFMSENSKEEKDTGPKNESTSQNEFSRTVRVNKWFAVGAGTNNRRNKAMNLSISATSSEREALAKRFRLSNISALSAEMVVQPAVGDNDDTGCIEAKGTITAQVTQTCVRTNEGFDVDLEFPFHTVLRAMEAAATSTGGGVDTADSLSEGELAALDAAAQLGGGRQRKKKGGGGGGGGKQKRDKGVKGVRGGQSSRDLDAMGMKELQNILQEYEVLDEIIEDDSCFCTDGIVDVGEIVAQIVRSKLDPYPKKPGTDRVSYSFTF